MGFTTFYYNPLYTSGVISPFLYSNWFFAAHVVAVQSPQNKIAPKKVMIPCPQPECKVHLSRLIRCFSLLSFTGSKIHYFLVKATNIYVFFGCPCIVVSRGKPIKVTNTCKNRILGKKWPRFKQMCQGSLFFWGKVE